MNKRTILIKQHRISFVQITEVSMTSVIGTQLEMADDTHEPSNVLIRKIEQVAELLGCSEEEAQRLVLHHQQ